MEHADVGEVEFLSGRAEYVGDDHELDEVHGVGQFGHEAEEVAGQH